MYVDTKSATWIWRDKISLQLEGDVPAFLPKNDHWKWMCELESLWNIRFVFWLSTQFCQRMMIIASGYVNLTMWNRLVFDFLLLADRMCTLPVHLSCPTHHQHAFLPLPEQQAITLHETEIFPKGNRMRMPEVLILQRRDGSLWMWTKCGFDFKPAGATCRPNVDPQLE
jgi:hypothetical protein